MKQVHSGPRPDETGSPPENNGPGPDQRGSPPVCGGPGLGEIGSPPARGGPGLGEIGSPPAQATSESLTHKLRFTERPTFIIFKQSVTKTHCWCSY